MYLELDSDEFWYNVISELREEECIRCLREAKPVAKYISDKFWYSVTSELRESVLEPLSPVLG